MVVLGFLGGEWQGLLWLQACWKWLSFALQNVSDWACFVFQPTENDCPWLSRRWVTGLALFQACWKWLSLPLQFVSDSLFCFQACWKWLCLALQDVSDWGCFVFKPAENGCPCVKGLTALDYSAWVRLWCCGIKGVSDARDNGSEESVQLKLDRRGEGNLDCQEIDEHKTGGKV